MVNEMTKRIDLTPEQREAICEIDRNLQIIACAGSGKTEVISRRIAHILKEKPDVLPEQIVAFTFTRKAAESLRQRIANAMEGIGDCDIGKMYIGTIHGYCYHLLCRFSDQFASYKVLDSVTGHHFITRYHEYCGMKDLGLEPYPRNISLFQQCIEKLLDDQENSSCWPEINQKALDNYISCLYGHGYVDYSLLVSETLHQIQTNPAVQAELNQIRYLVVDEYQDVDDLQERLVSCFASAGANICVVGDDDQTIYQFRGSNADHMIGFTNRYADVHQVRLEKNFRCSEGTVDLADHVIQNNPSRLPKKMVSAARSQQCKLKATRYSSKDEQFFEIAKAVQELHADGLAYNEIAILVRKGKAIAPISSALQRAGIPYESDCSEELFQGAHFARFVAALQMLEDVDKGKFYESWGDVLDDAHFKIGFTFLRRCSRGWKSTLSALICDFCYEIGFLEGNPEDLPDRQDCLNGIRGILDDYDAVYGDWQLSARVHGLLHFLGSFASEVYRHQSFQTQKPDDCVQVMTVHKAKGLEFHTVFLPEMAMREFPASNYGGRKYWHILGEYFEQRKAKYDTNISDERKLFYVAATRAKSNLFITYELSTQPISQFVIEAAESKHLKIDRSDLSYSPKEDREMDENFLFNEAEQPDQEDYEAEREARRVYWETVKYARSQLYDYYGTACHFSPAAYGDLTRLSTLSPDEILLLAASNGLI